MTGVDRMIAEANAELVRKRAELNEAVLARVHEFHEHQGAEGLLCETRLVDDLIELVRRF